MFWNIWLEPVTVDLMWFTLNVIQAFNKDVNENHLGTRKLSLS